VVLAPEATTSGSPPRTYDYAPDAFNQQWVWTMLNVCYDFVNRCP
jgi:hypothetical protein